MPQRIGVIGTFIRDTIVTLDGKTVESIGGLYHTLAYLAHLADATTEIQPLGFVGEDFYDTIQKTLTQFNKKILFTHLHRVPQPNTQVTLTYLTPETREELTTPGMPPITSAEILALTGCEAVLANLITGSDIALEALKTLRKSTPSPLIYLDLHSLALGIDKSGKRYYRPIPEAADWVAACHILQLNEHEAATLAGFGKTATYEDLVKFGQTLAAGNLLACHITLGSAGSLLFYRQHNTVDYEHVSPAPVGPVVDIIGCGDAFGAAFLTHFMKSKNFSAATHFANRVAGLNGTFVGSLTPDIFRHVIKPQLDSFAS